MHPGRDKPAARALDSHAVSSSSTKQELREWARAVRSQQMTAGAGRLNELILEALRRHPKYEEARTVAAYLAFGDEVDLGALFQGAGKRFALPRTHRKPAPHLTLHEVTGAQFADPEAWDVHRFGQLEPLATAPIVGPEMVDLMLVPGLSFDLHGYRLGYGMGFYDRLIPQLRKGAVVVGVTLDALVVPALPHEDHDAPMGYLLTESGWREAASDSSQLG